MAAKHVVTNEASSNFYENGQVSLSSECQCCFLLRIEVCYLINELKSMTEIINILKEEVKYDRAVNHNLKTYSDCVKNPKIIHSQRENCSKLESQLKLANNLNTVKQTTEILTEETKLVKQTLHKASNTYNPLLTSSNKLYGSHSVQPPSRKPSTYGTNGTPNTYQYSVPIANRYTALLN
jgi:hypothetical protein